MWNIFYTFACMKKTNCIKKVIRCAALCAAALLVASCAEKPKSDNIIVHKRAKVQKKQTQAMSGYEDKRNVGKAFQMYPLAFALSTADCEATYFLEGNPS